MMLKSIRQSILLILATLPAGTLIAQSTLKFENGGGPSGSGPSTTALKTAAAPQAAARQLPQRQ